MKLVCPTCGIMGSVQQRYKSFRIGHYDGYKGTTIKVKWHSTTLDALMVNNPNLNMVNNKLEMVNNTQDLALDSQNSHDFETMRQTHNLETTRANAYCQKSRARIPPPAPKQF